MTDQELIQALRCCNGLNGCTDCPRQHYGQPMLKCTEEVLNEAIDRLEALLAENERLKGESKWVSVEERLPPENVRVLVYLEKYLQRYTPVDTDRILGDIWVRWHGRITHWMPLPEPPRTEVE